MATFYCKVCGIDYKNKQSYKRHLNTARHKKRAENTDSQQQKLVCVCGKSYDYHQSLYVHRRNCEIYKKSKMQDEDKNAKLECLQSEKDEMEQKLILFEKERDELRAQIALLLDKHAGSTTTNNQHIETQNIETQQNIHIHINAFGHENIDYLDEKAIVACIDRVYKSVPAILEKIHFDPNHPENHNIKITNRKLPYASVMGENKKWKTVDKKDAIETMVFNGYNLLDEKYPDNKDNLTNYKREKFEDFQDNFQNEDRKLHKQLRTDVELMILNQ